MSTPIRRTALVSALVCLSAGLFLVSRAPGSDSSSSSNPPMLSVCITPSGDYHCGLTTQDIKIRASTCGMPGPAASDWSIRTVLGLTSYTGPTYSASCYEWTFGAGLHPVSGPVTISGAFTFAGGQASRVEEYNVVTLTGVTASTSVAPAGSMVTFTATSTPGNSLLRCDTHAPQSPVTWQYTSWTDPQQTQPAQDAQWNAMTNVSAGRSYAYLASELVPGFYMVEAQLCSASAPHRSPKVTVVGIEHLVVSEANVEDTTIYLCKGQTYTLTATPSPGATWPTGQPTWSSVGGPGDASITVPTSTTGATEYTATCGTTSKTTTARVVSVDVTIVLGDASPLDMGSLSVSLNGHGLETEDMSITDIVSDGSVVGKTIVFTMPCPSMPCSFLHMPGSNDIKVSISDVAGNAMDEVTQTFVFP